MGSPSRVEEALYRQVWSDIGGDYGEVSPGERHVPLFRQMSGAKPGEVVLDAACGSGKGAVALDQAGFSVMMCDLTDVGLTDVATRLPFFKQCLWDDVDAEVDHVYCCDVMEHIPTEFTMLVVHRLLSAVRRGVFFSISLVPDQFGVWVGEPLHKTVRDFSWWRERLGEVGTVADARDLGAVGMFYVRPS